MGTVLIPIPDRDFDPTEVAVSWQVLRANGHRVVFATESGAPGVADDIMVTGRGLDLWSALPVLGAIAGERTDPVGHSAQLTPRNPVALIFQSSCTGLQTHDIGDTSTERMRRHRILGSGVRRSPCADSSAVPIGFPSLV